MSHIVVIGAGQAGASLVAKLRKNGFDGEITLIGAEPYLPYQRPPLSKAYLLGDMELERMFLRPLKFYIDNNIKLILGQTVGDIDTGSAPIRVTSPSNPSLRSFATKDAPACPAPITTI